MVLSTYRYTVLIYLTFFGVCMYMVLRCSDTDVGARVGLNLLLALAPVTWFSVYTALLVTIKWVVLGRCFQGRIPLSSPTYLAWWYMNATLKVWERTGGWWLLDTRVLVLVYRLLGAHVRPDGCWSRYSFWVLWGVNDPIGAFHKCLRLVLGTSAAG